MKTTLLANVLILIAPFLLAIFYPQVGKLAGILGSFSALGCIYVMPTITYLKSLYTQVKNPLLAEAIRMNRFTYKSPASPSASTDDSSHLLKSPQIQVPASFLTSRHHKQSTATEEHRRRNYHI